MKQIGLLTSLMVFSGLVAPATANASHIHANTIIAHNIAAIQHTITDTAFASFGGSMATSLGRVADTPQSPQETEDPKTTYGHAQVYGTAPEYGEFNDDGTAGRSGGDIFNSDTMLTGLWLNWQHNSDNAKFDNFSRLDTDTDTIMFGFSGGQVKLWNGTSKWGMYVGYAHSDQENSHIKLSEQGGYVGVYNGNKLGNFNIYASINSGAMDSTIDTTHGTDGFTNFWLGGMARATYTWALDNSFSIQPGLNIGYTWIKSKDYTSASGDILDNAAFSMFEISPSVRAIKHIGNGWHGSLNAAYVIIDANGGELSVNGVDADNLESGNFMQYSLSLEKSITNLTFSAIFGRRDGARDGWIGGLNIKYAF